VAAPPAEERLEHEPTAPPPAPPVPVAEPPAAQVSRPHSMNFKLSPEQAEALALHRFRTGRQKQAIVSEALDMWLSKNKKLVQ
jgi:hypothetical protein